MRMELGKLSEIEIVSTSQCFLEESFDLTNLPKTDYMESLKSVTFSSGASG